MVHDSDPIYLAAIAADDAYGAELRRLYGASACDARYDARGSATDTLRTLWAAKCSADARLREFMLSRTADPFEALRETKLAAERAHDAYMAALEHERAATTAVGRAFAALIDAQGAVAEAYGTAYPPRHGQ